MENKPVTTHGGKRKGAGRKPGFFPVFVKKLRATEEERSMFNMYMTGDARRDFTEILDALRYRKHMRQKITNK
jgi:hypothetical protein